MTACRLLLLPFALLWAVDAHRYYEKDSYSGTRWLENGRSLLVRLDTPDLLDTQIRTAKDTGTSLIFNFTLQDQRVLLLNDVPIFPLEKAYVPPRLTPASPPSHRQRSNKGSFPISMMPLYTN